VSLETYWLVAPFGLAIFGTLVAIVGVRLIELAGRRHGHGPAE
jgi:hypothetical protein